MSDQISPELRHTAQRVLSIFTSEVKRQAWLAERLGIIDDAADPDWQRTQRRIQAYLCENHGLQTYKIGAMPPAQITALLRGDWGAIESEQTEHVIQVKDTAIIIDGKPLTLGGVARESLLRLCKNHRCTIQNVDKYQVRDIKAALDERGHDWFSQSIVAVRNDGYCLGLPLNCRIEQ